MRFLCKYTFHRSTALRVVVIGVALAVVIGASFSILSMHFGRDQGIYGVVGRTILEGGAPYKDAWDFKPPAIHFLYAAAAGLFGESVHSIRILEICCLLFTGVILLLLFKKLTGRWTPGLVASAVAFYFHAQLGFWSTGQPESFGGPLLLFAVFLSLRALEKNAKVPSGKTGLLLCAAGALFTAAAFLKPPLGGGVLVALILALVRMSRPSKSSPSGSGATAASLLGVFAGGAALVLAPLLFFFLDPRSVRRRLSDFFRFRAPVHGHSFLTGNRARPAGKIVRPLPSPTVV